jgi:predicted RNA-binding Zn ribbon-like protein
VPLLAHVLDDIEPVELEFQFGNGSIALDLVATVGERWARSFERLRSPEDLRRWLREEQLIGRATITAADLASYRELRSAIFDLVQARRAHRLPPRGSLRIVNGAAKAAQSIPRLTSRWHTASNAADPVGAAAATVAADAIALLSEIDPSRIRECAADDCSRLFVDRSRPGRRRWCESTGCGNRAKTAAYRRRRSRNR